MDLSYSDYSGFGALNTSKRYKEIDCVKKYQRIKITII